ncbi:MAG: hypothetical protein WC352_06800 [Candidatus Omnitrophota bacterium]|jgi:phosphotransacetylase
MELILGTSGRPGSWPEHKIRMHIYKRYRFMLKNFQFPDGTVHVYSKNPNGLDIDDVMEAVLDVLRKAAYDYDPRDYFSYPLVPISDEGQRQRLLEKLQEHNRRATEELSALSQRLAEAPGDEKARLAMEVTKKTSERDYVFTVMEAHLAVETGRSEEALKKFDVANTMQRIHEQRTLAAMTLVYLRHRLLSMWKRHQAGLKAEAGTVSMERKLAGKDNEEGATLGETLPDQEADPADRILSLGEARLRHVVLPAIESFPDERVRAILKLRLGLDPDSEALDFQLAFQDIANILAFRGLTITSDRRGRVESPQNIHRIYRENIGKLKRLVDWKLMGRERSEWTHFIENLTESQDVWPSDMRIYVAPGSAEIPVGASITLRGLVENYADKFLSVGMSEVKRDELSLEQVRKLPFDSTRRRYYPYELTLKVREGGKVVAQYQVRIQRNLESGRMEQTSSEKIFDAAEEADRLLGAKSPGTAAGVPGFDRISEYFRRREKPVTVVVPLADSESVLTALNAIAIERPGKFKAILVGDEAQIRRLIDENRLDALMRRPSPVEIVDARDEDEAYQKAFERIREGGIDLMIKGKGTTGALLGAALKPKAGEGLKGLISNDSVHQRVLWRNDASDWIVLTDGGINIKAQGKRPAMARELVRSLNTLGRKDPLIAEVDGSQHDIDVAELFKAAGIIFNSIDAANMIYKALAMDLPWKLIFKERIPLDGGGTLFVFKRESKDGQAMNDLMIAVPPPGAGLKEKEKTLEQALAVAKKEGTGLQKVALLNFSEEAKRFEKVPSIQDSNGLVSHFAGNPDCVVEGPMDLYIGLDRHAADIKGFMAGPDGTSQSRVSGQPDILMTPDSAGQILAWVYAHWTELALPWQAADYSDPLIFSRADEPGFKKDSIHTAIFMRDHQGEPGKDGVPLTGDSSRPEIRNQMPKALAVDELALSREIRDLIVLRLSDPAAEPEGDARSAIDHLNAIAPEYLTEYFRKRAELKQMTLAGYRDWLTKPLPVEDIRELARAFSGMASRATLNYSTRSVVSNRPVQEQMKALVLKHLKTERSVRGPMVFRFTGLGNLREFKQILRVLRKALVEVLSPGEEQALLRVNGITDIDGLARSLDLDFRFYDLRGHILSQVPEAVRKAGETYEWFRPRVRIAFFNATDSFAGSDWEPSSTALVVSRNIFGRSILPAGRAYLGNVSRSLEEGGIFISNLTDAVQIAARRGHEGDPELTELEPVYLSFADERRTKREFDEYFGVFRRVPGGMIPGEIGNFSQERVVQIPAGIRLSDPAAFETVEHGVLREGYRILEEFHAKGYLTRFLEATGKRPDHALQCFLRSAVANALESIEQARIVGAKDSSGEIVLRGEALDGVFRFQVADNGTGFRKEFLDIPEEPKSSKRAALLDFKHTGGRRDSLWLAHFHADHMRGHLQVRNRSGQSGAEITFLLPFGALLAEAGRAQRLESRTFDPLRPEQLDALTDELERSEIRVPANPQRSPDVLAQTPIEDLTQPAAVILDAGELVQMSEEQLDGHLDEILALVEKHKAFDVYIDRTDRYPVANIRIPKLQKLLNEFPVRVHVGMFDRTNLSRKNILIHASFFADGSTGEETRKSMEALQSKLELKQEILPLDYRRAGAVRAFLGIAEMLQGAEWLKKTGEAIAAFAVFGSHGRWEVDGTFLDSVWADMKNNYVVAWSA